MNLKMAARRLGVHYQTAYRWVRSGALVAVKVGPGYEISEAAIERFQAQRAALERIPDTDARTPLPTPIDDESALDVLDSMIDAVVTDASAVYQRAARFIAEVVRDGATVSIGSGPDDLAVVAYDHHDPRHAVLMGSLVHEGRSSRPTVADKALRTGEAVVMAQVPQRMMRPVLRSEYHQFIAGSTGYYSALSVPIIVGGAVRGALLAARDQPGDPLGDDDRDFVAAVAERVEVALVRSERASQAWELRRELVERLADLAEPTAEAVGAVVPEGAAVAFVRPDGVPILVTEPVSEMFGTPVERLISDPAAQIMKVPDALIDCYGKMVAGELDFATVTVEPVAPTAAVMVHGAAVRRPDATLVGVVWVAHALPTLAAYE